MHTVSKDGQNAHFNSDLGGDVRFDFDDGHVDIPGTLVKAVVAYYVRNNKIALIEDATDDEILLDKQGTS